MGITTGQEMLDALSYRVRDPGLRDEMHSTTAFLRYLNLGMSDIVAGINSHLLPPLDTTTTQLVLDENGQYDLSNLSVDSLYGDQGIKGIRLTDGMFLRRVSFDEFKLRLNSQVVGSIDGTSKIFEVGDYVYLIDGSKISTNPYIDFNIESGSIVAGIDYYIAGYTDLTYNSILYHAGDVFTGVDGQKTYTIVGAGSVIEARYIDIDYHKLTTEITLSSTSDFDPEINEAIIQRAAYYVFMQDGQNNDMTIAEASSSQMVEKINTRGPPTDSNTLRVLPNYGIGNELDNRGFPSVLVSTEPN